MKRENTKKNCARIGCRAVDIARHNKDSARQRLRNGGLNNQVGGVAKRTIGLNRLAVRVRMPDLHDPAESNKCTAEKAEHYPQQVTCS